MMGVKLKPCPFCGSIDIYETHSQEDTLGTKNPEIFCNSCKIIFSIEDDSPYTDHDEDYAYRKAKTVEAWNMRPLQEIDLVRCEECKKSKLYAMDSSLPISRWCHRFSVPVAVEDDDYCSYAERRIDERINE